MASGAGSSWRWRSAPTRRCCSWTSPAPAERQDFSRLIAALPREVTVVLIEHDMDVALGLADRVTMLHNGAVIFEGAPEAVQRNPQVREVYFGKA